VRSWGALAFVVLVLGGSWTGGAAAQQQVNGQARVIDGDTLAIGETRVRLFGIDAPERGQPCRAGGDCGARAQAHLDELIAGRAVSCREEDVDRYGRVVATCYAGETELNRAMVRAGHALPYVEFSRRYVGDVSGEPAFAAPWDFRRGVRAGATRNVADRPGNDAADEDCAIKGNIGRAGARIYHRPGQPNYVATRIDPARGERWFCSVAEAEAAGWRAVRR